MRLIDADKLDDVVIGLNQKGWAITRNEYKRIDGILFEFPTVDPVKHGRWIEHHSVRGVYYSCSNCKAEGYGRYCQNCGAKMTYEEEQDEAD